MRGADFLVRALEREGVDCVFGYPGGAIMPVYDALVGSKVRHVLVRHEQAAALAANGYARATGRVGVCIATSGPGATNLVTGIADAFMDSVPVVAITGQVPTPLMGTDAFQEVDIFGITMPIVKHSFIVRDLATTVAEAFSIARSGRPGPVLLDLPKDVANADVDVAYEPLRDAPPGAPDMTEALRLLRECRRPVVYAGGGVQLGRAVPEFRAFVERARIPVVATLKGLGVVPTNHELYLGMIGMHGSKAANLAVQGSDLLLAVGVRFDDRATGKPSLFAPEARVVHLDADRAEIGKLRGADAPVAGDLRAALRGLAFPLRIGEWRSKCLQWKARHAWEYDAPTDGVFAPLFLKMLSEAADEETVVACDVGQHQMWVAQHWLIRRPDRHLSSGGLGTMGFGMPAAIGAQLGCPGATVINVTGDGSIMMNLQELATIARYALPIRIVLIDNGALGMVRQWQELFFDKRYSEVDLSDNPDFARMAEVFGLEAFRVERADEMESAVDRLLHAEGPILAHVKIDREANVWPLVPPGASNSQMMEAKP